MHTTETEIVETGEKRDGRGRKLSPMARRMELVRAYRGSGLTMTAFARREGVKYSTFAGWVLRSGRRREGRLAPVRFAEACLPGPWARPAPAAADAARLEVRLPDGTLLCGGEATELAKLVRALREG